MNLFSYLAWGTRGLTQRRVAAPSPVRLHLQVLENRNLLSVTLIDNHIDLGVDYGSNGFHLDVREQDNGIRYGPDAVLQYLDDNSLQTQPNDPNYDFIGAGEGNPVWIIPINRQPNRLYTGFSAEGLAPGTFDTYFESDPRINQSGEFITLSLVDVSSPDGGNPPGNFSLFQTNGVGAPVIWMSTFQNPNSNAFFVQPGDHIHTFWGFTAPGRYDVEIQASAFMNGNLIQSHLVTWHFGVDDFTDFPPPNPPAPSPHDRPTPTLGAAAFISAADATLLPNQLVGIDNLQPRPLTASQLMPPHAPAGIGGATLQSNRFQFLDVAPLADSANGSISSEAGPGMRAEQSANAVTDPANLDQAFVNLTGAL